MPRLSRAALLAVALATAVALPACGDDDDADVSRSADTSSTSTTDGEESGDESTTSTTAAGGSTTTTGTGGSSTTTAAPPSSAPPPTDDPDVTVPGTSQTDDSYYEFAFDSGDVHIDWTSTQPGAQPGVCEVTDDVNGEGRGVRYEFTSAPSSATRPLPSIDVVVARSVEGPQVTIVLYASSASTPDTTFEFTPGDAGSGEAVVRFNGSGATFDVTAEDLASDDGAEATLTGFITCN